MQHTNSTNKVAVEPELVNEPSGAALLSVSPRSFRHLIARGDVRPVQIPGMRRKAYVVSELRALAQSWRSAR